MHLINDVLIDQDIDSNFFFFFFTFALWAFSIRAELSRKKIISFYLPFPWNVKLMFAIPRTSFQRKWIFRIRWKFLHVNISIEFEIAKRKKTLLNIAKTIVNRNFICNQEISNNCLVIISFILKWNILDEKFIARNKIKEGSGKTHFPQLTKHPSTWSRSATLYSSSASKFFFFLEVQWEKKSIIIFNFISIANVRDLKRLHKAFPLYNPSLYSILHFIYTDTLQTGLSVFRVVLKCFCVSSGWRKKRLASIMAVLLKKNNYQIWKGNDEGHDNEDFTLTSF